MESLSATKSARMDAGRLAPPAGGMSEGTRGGLLSALCCTLGMAGAQTWMPAIGLFSDMYRMGGFSIGLSAPLFLSYLLSLAIVAVLFSAVRMRSEPTKGTYAVLVGALLSCIGAVLLLLFDQIAPEKMGLLFVLVGLLLGSGNCLMVMTWISPFACLRKRCLFGSALAVALCCCGLASFAQVVGASSVLLIATVVLSAVSAGCYVLMMSRSEAPSWSRRPGKAGFAYARIGVSLGCFGLLFSMMIMQFAIAPHGQASSSTWMFGFAGILSASAMLVASRIVRKTWDFLFAYRFAAIPVLIAFFPFDPGSDFSLKFALWFSTMALWCFLTIAPGVIREAAAVLRVPAFFPAGIAIGGLCIGAIIGYLVAWLIEMLGPTQNYFINITAIISMAIGLIGSNMVLTRGSLMRAFRKSAILDREGDESDTAMGEKVALAVEAFGLTRREWDVLSILARGHGLARVQEDLFISEGTALTHKRHIYQKLNVHSKSELIDLITRMGVDDCEED